MLTRFVLLGAVSGGLLVFANPIAFGWLLALRYPERRKPTVRTNETATEPAEALLPGPSGRGTVIGPERLESLRAARERRRMESAPADDRAA